MNDDQCYMCSRQKTSREHVPPKCIFPDYKFSVRDFRKNLITVPSCDTHNTHKSEDDEFLRFILVMHFNNNLAGKRLFHEKVRPAVRRSRSKYAAMVEEDFPWKVGGQDFHVAKVDSNRVNRCFEQITRAIFFHHHDVRLEHPIQISVPDMKLQNRKGEIVSHNPTVNLFKVTKEFIGESEPYSGNNPKIFKYRHRYNESEQLFALEMQFFEAFRVSAVSGILSDEE